MSLWFFGKMFLLRGENNLSRSLSRKKLLVSFFILLVSICICLLLTRFRFIYSTNDDYIFSWMIFQGEEKSIFYNYFLQTFFVAIQKLFPFINCFCVFEIISCSLSLLAIIYVILNKFEGLSGIVISIIFSIIISVSSIIMIQWTQTTTLMCSAGFFLLVYAWKCEEHKGYKVLQIVCSVYLVLVGSMFRFISFKVCVLLFGLYFIYIYFEKIFVLKGKIINRVSLVLRNNAKVIVSFVLIVIISFSCNYLSSIICNSDEVYRSHVAYNSARAKVTDYDPLGYEGNESFYNSIDVLSQEDIDMLTRRHMDTDFFTVERLSMIGDYSHSTNGIAHNAKFALTKSAKKIYRLILDIKQLLHLPFSNFLYLTMLVIIASLVLLLLIISLVKIKKRNETKYHRLLRILLLVFVVLFEALYILLFRINSNSCLVLLLFAIIILCVLFFELKALICTLLMSTISLALVVYQSYFRTSFRVNYTALLPVILILLLYLCNHRVLPWSSSINKVVGICGSSLSIALVVVSFVFLWNGELAPNIVSYNDSLKNYIEEHHETTFMHLDKEYAKLDIGYINTFPPIQYPDNTVVYGSFQTTSVCYENRLVDKGINKLFKEMIDSNDRRFIISSYSDFDIINTYEIYYNNHYAVGGKTIKLELEDEIETSKTDWRGNTEVGTVGIYKVLAY